MSPDSRASVREELAAAWFAARPNDLAVVIPDVYVDAVLAERKRLDDLKLWSVGGDLNLLTSPRPRPQAQDQGAGPGATAGYLGAPSPPAEAGRREPSRGGQAASTATSRQRTLPTTNEGPR